MFTLSTAGFSRSTSPSTTESVHQSNNSTNTSNTNTNNIQGSLLRLSNSSKKLPRMYEISPEKRQYIEDNFRTGISGINSFNIISYSNELPDKYSHNNKYKPDKWTFKVNFRNKEESEVFASHITAYQYELVAKENGFYGELPQTIKRKNVVNKETLSLTKGKHGEELYNIFFEKTPNGKSTKRIMDNFGLRATAVRRVEQKISFNESKTHFYIDIAPVNSKVTTK
ncbi:hypothetical protein [Candidatus Williamhamiltonella defendens]|uniref:Uncharacterized protein n=1 Tax=Candidatus Hamiltonella defensa (Bemisia tabaci) TaxID=672795 RepID=A0A0E4G3B7_9ENTR|nr:hypothetical protein [Candidatus Hamiltonella defensa]ASX26149.1 hypothetical protein BA171_03345 [Candidatus Hamiltonella defensa (Bemisia tabaci)]CED78753.1 Conserved hypothetical protein [Candidatus Hamiltonella defensa (Bemisia tabaci)]CED78867.1 Conserved hypothetical protein [Candidatus Hamiltonella defensa (Bemisia tabaci)]